MMPERTYIFMSLFVCANEKCISGPSRSFVCLSFLPVTGSLRIKFGRMVPYDPSICSLSLLQNPSSARIYIDVTVFIAPGLRV